MMVRRPKTTALAFALSGLWGTVVAAQELTPSPEPSPLPVTGFNPDVVKALPTAGSLHFPRYLS